MSGKLLVIEGLDGSGKATQTSLLCEELTRRNLPWRKVSFPDYGEPSSALVKMYLNGEFGKDPNDVNGYAASLFYAADRYASYRKFWQEDYESGKWIIADRYTTSNLVYQMRKFPREQWDGFISWMEDLEYEKLGIPRPTAVIYLDMSPEISQKLLTSRYHGDETRKDIHESNMDFLAGCRESAAYAARKLGWRVISCVKNGGPKSVGEIQEEMRKAIMEDFDRLC